MTLQKRTKWRVIVLLLACSSAIFIILRSNHLIDALKKDSLTLQQNATFEARMSVLVLFRREYGTLNATLASWEERGLVPYISELVIFMNGMTEFEKKWFFARIPRLNKGQWLSTRITVLHSILNKPLGIAIGQASQAAVHDIILLLEKDWKLIEGGEILKEELSVAAKLVSSGVADAVRLRHRNRPGIPVFGRLNYEGYEVSSVLKSDKGSICNFHMWKTKLDEQYPEIFRKCGETSRGSRVWCVSSEYCGWTNNPVLFKKMWYHEALYLPYQRYLDYNRRKKPPVQAQIFENWARIPSVWSHKNYTIALPKGLFEHHEIGEQTFYNKFHSVWRRLSNNMNSSLRMYFLRFQHECSTSKKWSHSYGKTIKERFPVEFVRNFHFRDVFSLSDSEICRKIRSEVERIIYTGPAGLNWLESFRSLSRRWKVATLSKFPVDPKEMKISFVTAINASEEYDGNEFCYMLHALRFYDNVVYATSTDANNIRNILRSKYNWTANLFKSLTFLETSQFDLVDRIFGIKHNPLLEEARRLVLESPDILSPILLRDVMRLSMEGVLNKSSISYSSHFVWLDSQMSCIKETIHGSSHALTNHSDHVLRGNLWFNFMVIENRSGNRDHLKDTLEDMNVFTRYIVQKPRIVTGRTIGGSRMAIEAFVGYYDILLTWALKKGFNPSRKSLLTVISNVRSIEVPVHFAKHENFSMKTNDCHILRYTGQCAKIPLSERPSN